MGRFSDGNTGSMRDISAHESVDGEAGAGHGLGLVGVWEVMWYLPSLEAWVKRVEGAPWHFITVWIM